MGENKLQKRIEPLECSLHQTYQGNIAFQSADFGKYYARNHSNSNEATKAVLCNENDNLNPVSMSCHR